MHIRSDGGVFRSGLLAVACALLLVGRPGQAQSQTRQPISGSTPVAGPLVREAYPEFRAVREVALAGFGTAMLVAGHFLAGDGFAVPSDGLDPSAIRWSVDRRVIGTASLDAHLASHWTRNAALVFPLALALATGPSGTRWEGFGRSSAVITQTIVVSQGITKLGKSALGRPRPYTYVSDDVRVEDPSYDVTSAGAFASMPSGHSSSAWTGATLAVTEYLLGHPDAHWPYRSGLGLVGGALAGATSALRVEAGQHFPSDVLVGAGIGILSGVAVPMLHRGQRARPSTGAWMEAAGGLVAGTLFGLLFARRY